MTSDGEFLTILRLVAWCVRIVVEAALDVFCGFLLLVAAILPWRLVGILRSIFVHKGTLDTRNKFREWAITNLAATILDCLAIPLVLVACCVPTRLAVIVAGTGFELRRPQAWAADCDFDWDLRLFWLKQFFSALLDLPCIVLGLVALVMPWRTTEVVIGSLKIWGCTLQNSCLENGLEQFCEECDSSYQKLRCWWLSHGVQAPLDIIFVSLGLASIMVPTRTWPLLKELRRSLADPPPPWTERHGGCASCFVRVDWLRLWELAALNFFTALLDVLALPAGLFAILVPSRSCVILHELRFPNLPARIEVVIPESELVVIMKLNKRKTYKGHCSYEGGTELEGRTKIKFVLQHTGDQHKWQFIQRDAGGDTLLTSVGDVEGIYPGMSPHEIGPNAWAPRRLVLRAKMPSWKTPIEFRGQHFYNPSRSIACLRQSAEAMLDLLFLPLMAISFVSLYRASPLVKLLVHGEKKKRGVRVETLRQASLLLLDVAVLPGMLIVFMTYYRSPWVVRHMGKGFDVHRALFHVAVIKNAAVVLHDILMLPVVLVLCITCWRLPQVLLVVWPSRPVQPTVVDELVTEPPDNGLEVARTHLEQLRQQDPEGEDEWDLQLRMLTQLMPGETDVIVERETLPPPPSTEMSFSFPGPVRSAVWSAAADLAVDLPHVIAALLTLIALWRALQLLRRGWTARNAAERRRLALHECFTTVRDFLFFPLFVVLAVTLYRFPLVVTSLRARSRAPLRGTPRCQAVRVRMRFRSRDGMEVEVTVQPREGEASLPGIRHGSLAVRVLGTDFWQQVGATLGQSTASFGQGMMPFGLKAKTTDAYDALCDETIPSHGEEFQMPSVTFSFKLEAKMKRSTIARKLGQLGDVAMVVQLEASDKGKKQPFLLATARLRSSSLARAASSQTGDGDMTELLLIDEAVEVSEHVGLVDSFWVVVGMEAWQLLLDVLHTLLILFICLVPWRAAMLCKLLCEPKDRWSLRMAKKAIHWLNMGMHELACFEVDFEQHCNECLKRHHGDDHSLLHGQHESEYLSKHGQLAQGVRKAAALLGSDFAERLEYCLDVQDACLYFPALRSFAHCMLMKGQISVEEHAVVLQEVAAASKCMKKVKARAHSSLVELQEEQWADAIRNGFRKCGVWRKDVGVIRRIIRIMATAAVADIAGFMATLLLLVTIFRVPLACRDLVRARVFNPIRGKFRNIVVSHLRAHAWCCYLLLQVVVLSGLLVLTLAGVPGALNHTVSVNTLEELRDVLLQDLIEALADICNLLSLLQACETYVLLCRAVLQSVLVAPACISDLAGKFLPCCPLVPRFLLGILLCGALLASPFISELGPLAFFIALCVIVLLRFAISLRRTEDGAIHGWQCMDLRLTWANIVACLQLISDPCILVTAFLTFSGESVFGFSTRAPLCQEFSVFTAVVTGIVLTTCWLLLVSLMFVTGQQEEHQTLQRHSFLRFLQLLLSQALSVPIACALLLPAACSGVDMDPPSSGNLQAPALLVLGVYVVTTQALSAESGLLEPLTDSCGIDLRYPARYHMGISTLYLALAASTMRVFGESDMAVAAQSAALGATAVAWTTVYACCLPVSCVPFVVALRVAGSMAIFATAVFVSVQLGGSGSPGLTLEVLGFVQAGIAMLGLMAGAVLQCLARRRAKRELASSGVQEAFEELLAQTINALETTGCVLIGDTAAWGERWRQEFRWGGSARTLGLQLLAFEADIRAERLSADFLANRKGWQRSLRSVRTFAELRKWAGQLRCALTTPPTKDAITRCMLLAIRPNLAKAVSNSRDINRLALSDPIATHILDYVVGHREIQAIMQPTLLCARSAVVKKIGHNVLCCCRSPGTASMKRHLERAKSSLTRAMIYEFKARGSRKSQRSETQWSTIAEVKSAQAGETAVWILDSSVAPSSGGYGNQSIWPSLTEPMETGGRLFDPQGNQHILLPQGLVVGLRRSEPPSSPMTEAALQFRPKRLGPTRHRL